MSLEEERQCKEELQVRKFSTTNYIPLTIYLWIFSSLFLYLFIFLKELFKRYQLVPERISYFTYLSLSNLFSSDLLVNAGTTQRPWNFN